MDREAFKQRMQQLKWYREQNPGKTYLDFKKYTDGGENVDDRTDHPINQRLELDRQISIADYINRVNHTDKNGDYNPFYQASDDTYGTVELPTVQITAPLTDQARRNIEARRGASYVDEGRRKAAPYVGAIVAGAALPAMASTGGLGTAIDIASTISNPTDPLNYIDKFKLWRALRIDKNSDHIVRALINKRQFKDLSTFGKDSDKYIHIDLGNKSSLFSGKGKGAYIKDNKLYPGESILPDQDSYVWWNKNKPYSDIGFNTDGHTTTIIDPDIAEDLLQVRMSNKPIGQWNGNNGFVLKSEYVTNKPVPLKHAQQYKYNGLIGTFENIKYFADGGEIPPSNKPIIPEEPQPYKGKLYKDRYGRKYTESQLDDYYDNSTDEIDRFTGKPFVRGLKPVGDIEDAANMTPVGDAISAYDIYSSIKQSDWQGAGLAAMGLIPFMPMTVKQFRSKYKGITPKQKYKAVSHDYNTSVNRNYIQDRIDEALAYDAAVNSKLTQAKNQTYNVVERLMDDPSYIERAKQVKTQFGDDYIQAYADIINLYNENPLELPNVERLNSGNSRARMQRNSNGTYSYKLDPDIADISAPVTEHELSHYADFKRNLDRPDPHGDSNMFYQMKKDISGRKIDSRDDYYSLPTEQKAHMNQLREYMFQNNYISTRGETVDEKLLKKAIQEADKLDSMRGVARASRQFKSFNKYTKWFNSIPLLGIGAAAVYNNNQEK